MEKTIAVLVAAHFLGDFMVHPGWLVERKKQIHFMLLHGFVHALLVYCLYQAWLCWELPLTILVVHLVIDLTKQKYKIVTAKVFAWDQIAHILSLIGIGWLLIESGYMQPFSGFGYTLIIGFAGFIATVFGSGYFVGKVAIRLKEQNQLEIDGLVNGGALIGNLERALIFLLIFIGQPAGIGFLIAAKSILRFEEAKKQKLAEYVLIGTLLSFSLAIAIASITQWVMKLEE
ncbi:MAG: DUF3307 domain-containing protein [Candidatus Sabulitectum sp.]|nr:DUF3307 domain-containing protein [Candidatus Sabulitectum sp.]